MIKKLPLTNKLFVSTLLFLTLCCCKSKQEPLLILPFSQYVVNEGTAGEWMYSDSPEQNGDVIAPPDKGEDWDEWYKKITDYQAYVRSHLNDTSAHYIDLKILKGKPALLDFNADRLTTLAYDMKLEPSEKIVVNGRVSAIKGIAKLYVDFQLKYKGNERSYDIGSSVNKIFKGIERVYSGSNWTSFREELIIPEFNADSFLVNTVLRFESADKSVARLYLKGITLSVPSTPDRVIKYNELSAIFTSKSVEIDRQLYERPETQWIKTDFVQGFVYVWDKDFWDIKKGEYKVKEYCDKMKQEFGGFQSVLIWQNFTNLGIDEKNQFDFYLNMPGGLKGLRKVVKEFHDNGVKVHLVYNPWDTDTRRSDTTVSRYYANLIRETDADGVYMDIINHSAGFQSEMDKYKRGAIFSTEENPSMQLAQGYYGLIASWAQSTESFNNHGVQQLKWIIPEHKQYRIQRGSRNRQSQLSFSWINGHGIVVWENVFGTMNKWNATDRQTLRRMNTIWQEFGELYASDSWKPYLPGLDQGVYASSWQDKDKRIWNIIADPLPGGKITELPSDNNYRYYYDLWTGRRLNPVNGKISLNIDRFSCVIGLKNSPSEAIMSLVERQNREHLKLLPADDKYFKVLSMKECAKPTLVPAKNPPAEIEAGLISIKGGEFNFTVKHIYRQSGCYPDEYTSGENNYITINEDGIRKIFHKHHTILPSYRIMADVVTNDQFEKFLINSGYKPRYGGNFLKHWKGNFCPDSIKNEPVIFVSLEDARAYAAWAGMRLPDEWEWQAAAETQGNKFVFNKVWEWNESERSDGHNRFVTLRGGCERWVMNQANFWYFPQTHISSPKGPGGRQPVDSHCKYFLMYPGLDRASTIGFRCIK